MKKQIIKFLISKNGYYDRLQLIELLQKTNFELVKHFYKKAIKPKTKKPVILSGGELFWINYSKNKFFPKNPFFKKLKRKIYAK